MKVQGLTSFSILRVAWLVVASALWPRAEQAVLPHSLPLRLPPSPSNIHLSNMYPTRHGDVPRCFVGKHQSGTFSQVVRLRGGEDGELGLSDREDEKSNEAVGAIQQSAEQAAIEEMLELSYKVRQTRAMLENRKQPAVEKEGRTERDSAVRIINPEPSESDSSLSESSIAADMGALHAAAQRSSPLDTVEEEGEEERTGQINKDALLQEIRRMTQPPKPSHSDRAPAEPSITSAAQFENDVRGPLIAYAGPSAPVFPDDTPAYTPQTIRKHLEGKSVRLMAAGHDHIVLVCDDGTVMTSGADTDHALGRPTTEKGPDGSGRPLGAVPAWELGAVQLQGKGAVQIACGAWHTLVVFESGELCGWGSNRYGQLGLGELTTVPTPTPIRMGPEAWPHMSVAVVASGDFHTLVLLKSGMLLACGKNSEGQLGIAPGPQPPAAADGMDLVKRLLRVRLGVEGPCRKLASRSHRDPRDVLRPTEVTVSQGRVETMVCGSCSSFLLVRRARSERSRSPRQDATAAEEVDGGGDGELAETVIVSFGANEAGQLGRGFVGGCSSVPAVVSGLPAVQAVYAGSYHVVAVDVLGRVWSWGLNDDGQLGIGSQTTHLRPALADLVPPSPTAVACGEDYTLFVSEKMEGEGQGGAGRGGRSSRRVYSTGSFRQLDANGREGELEREGNEGAGLQASEVPWLKGRVQRVFGGRHIALFAVGS